MYQPRTYRHTIKERDLITFNVTVRETDLYIRATANLEGEAYRLVRKYRRDLESYANSHPDFLTSLKPLPLDDGAPEIVRSMLQAAERAGVGPMAAVAGAIAQFVGHDLHRSSPEIIIENGGDIFMVSRRKRVVGIWAGDSPFSGRVGLEILGHETPLGICTSSGTVGHSLSFGRADAVVVLSPDTALADAAATAIGNAVSTPDDINKAIALAQRIDGLKGLVIIKDDSLGLWGKVRLIRTEDGVGGRDKTCQ